MFDLISGASLIVQAVLGALILASISSWAVIVYKIREIGAAERETQEFLRAYHQRPLDDAYKLAEEQQASPLSAVFRSGFSELARLEKMGLGADRLPVNHVAHVLGRLDWVQTEQMHRLERGLPYLATVGSASPFVGLFGTVVGIMNSFEQIGASGSASLAVVAPGIAEALVATAVGLFAAIPAVIAYNYSSARIGRVAERAHAFRSEYDEVLRRAASRPA